MSIKEDHQNAISSLYVLKGIGCFCVVLIHIAFPGMFGRIIKYVFAQFAVPVFLMISGYFAYYGDSAKIKRRLKKTVKIFLWGLVAFFIIRLIPAITGNEFLAWIKRVLSWRMLIRAVLFCTIDFAVPLWYLIAAIEIYLIWLFIVKKNKEKIAVRLTPYLFLLHILLTVYCETKGYEWCYKINAVTTAFPWFLTGYFMHTEKGEKVLHIPDFCIYALGIVGVMIAMLSVVRNTRLQFSSIGLIPYSFSLFVLALRNPEAGSRTIFKNIGKKLSLYVYILHIPVCSCLILLCDAFHINMDGTLVKWCMPIIVILLTTAISIFLRKKAEAYGVNRHSGR